MLSGSCPCCKCIGHGVSLASRISLFSVSVGMKKDDTVLANERKQRDDNVQIQHGFVVGLFPIVCFPRVTPLCQAVYRILTICKQVNVCFARHVSKSSWTALGNEVDRIVNGCQLGALIGHFSTKTQCQFRCASRHSVLNPVLPGHLTLESQPHQRVDISVFTYAHRCLRGPSARKRE